MHGKKAKKIEAVNLELFLKWHIYRVTEVRCKILTPLETTGGNSFSLDGFEKMLFKIQFKTLRRVIYIPLEIYL